MITKPRRLFRARRRGDALFVGREPLPASGPGWRRTAAGSRRAS